MQHSAIYLDHHATTPLDPRVLTSMMPFLTHAFGNPSSQHMFGQYAQEAVEKARGQVAQAIGASAAEIVFTSGATESNNMALKCLTSQLTKKGRHIVTVCTEHHAVLDTCHYLEQQGYEITYLEPNSLGLIEPEQVKNALRDDTVVVSVMLVNNEIGVIQPIEQIAHLAHKRGALMHCDAVQGLGRLPFTVDSLGVDLLSLSGHKIYGPKGVGALYIRRGADVKQCLSPMIHGGGQEKGRRSGTLNVPGIVGLGSACVWAMQELAEETARVAALRDFLWEQIRHAIADVVLNGCSVNRVAGNLSLSFPRVDGPLFKEAVCAKVAVSGTSACSSGGASHVLQALGKCPTTMAATLRFGLGRTTTRQEVEIAAEHVISSYRHHSKLNRRTLAMA